MRYLWLALCAACLAGCPGGGDTANTPDLALPAPDLTPKLLTWTTTVVDVQTMNPIMGGQVCLAPANQSCTTTNASGIATLTVPTNAMFMLSYAFQNYVPSFTEHTSTSADGGNTLLLVSTTNQGVLAAAVSKPLDTTKGNLVLSVIDGKSNPLAGASFAMTPVAGDGPYYFGGFGLPDKSATMTSGNGIGFVLNLSAADFDITATLPGKTCTGSVSKSWVGASAASVKGRVMNGSITTVSFLCQ